MTSSCHVAASSASDDLLVIQTPTIRDTNFKALVDSGATANLCSDFYVREKSLSTHFLTNPFHIRLADNNMSMAMYGINVEFNIC
jgi:hypothetical protein